MRARLAGLVLLCVTAAPTPAAAQQTTVHVASKQFTESTILGEMLAQLARSTGAQADHTTLGGTQLAFQGLLAGGVDVYPEYTGTIRAEILADRGLRNQYDMRRALAEQGIRMSAPLGFNNTYVLGMKENRAEALNIRTISDLRRHPELRLGFSTEFIGREDGWPSLRTRYQLPQQDVTALQHDLAYRALDTGAIDVTDLYSTDAEIQFYGLRALEDDLKHFPDYQAVLLYRADLQQRAPDVVAALLRLEGAIDAAAMIKMNAHAKIDKVPAARVAADFLQERFGIVGQVRRRTFAERVLKYTLDHLYLVAVSLSAAIAVAVPLGVLAVRRPALGQAVLAGVGLLQTVPSLALLVFMIPFLGIGAEPAIAGLFLYSLLPIVRNTHAGLSGIAPQLRESAEALGLPSAARLWKIELPLASRSILAGVKTSAVINVGTATLGGFIGAGGYGEPIFAGIQRADMQQTLLQGAVPAAVLALLVQGVFELAERYLVPRGLRL